MQKIEKKFLADFGMAKAILHIQSENALRFTITEKDGKITDISETVIIRMTEIRPKLFIVTWKEANGNTVTQIQDYEKGMYIQTEPRQAVNLKTYKEPLGLLKNKKRLS